MILHKVRIEGLGCFAAPYTAGPFSSGVNVVHAPNGSGKSTVARAVSLVFAEPHRSKSAEIKALRPWGRPLTPEIEIEFEHEGRAYKARKRFLDAPGASVERKDGGAWTAFAKGDEADEFLRGVLQTETRSRAAKLESLGIASVLWTTQGDIAMPTLSANVIESIRGSLGAQLSGGGSAIEAAVRAEYLKHYTPDRGSLRSGRNCAAQLRMEAELAGLTAALRDAEALLSQFNSESVRIEQLRDKVAGAEATRAELGRRFEHVRAAAAAYELLLTQKQVRTAERDGAQAKHKQLYDRIATIRTLRERVAVVEAQLTALAGRIPELEAQAETHRQSAQQADQEHAAAVARERQAREAIAVGQLVQEYANAQAEHGRLRQRLQDIEGAQREARGAENRKGEINAASEQQIRSVRCQIERENDLLRRLEMARVTVSFTPDQPVEIEVLAGEQPGPVSAAAGLPIELAGAPALSFRIAGMGQFDARGPVSEYESHRRELESVRACLVTVKQQFGSADPDELEARRRQILTFDAAIKEANRALSTLLAGDTEAGLRQAAERLSARIAEIEQLYPEWTASAPDAAALRTAADSEFEAASFRRSEAAAAVRTADALSADAAGAILSALERRTTLQASLESDRHLLAGSLADSLTDDQRQAQLDEAALHFDAARAALAVVESELCKFAADPRKEAEGLTSQIGQVERDAEQARRDLVVAETRIEGLVQRSPYTGYAELAERIAVQEAQLDRERLRMKALALLHQTLESSRADALSALAEPVEATASHYLEKICGQPVAEIRLTPSLSAETVIPAALAGSGDDPVPLDQLSGGEQEQVFLCTRLALGAEIACRERQMVVLDDAIIYTDDERMQRICELLESLSGRLQFLVFTCHPERFASLRGANRIHLTRAAALYAGAALE